MVTAVRPTTAEYGFCEFRVVQWRAPMFALKVAFAPQLVPRLVEVQVMLLGCTLNVIATGSPTLALKLQPLQPRIDVTAPLRQCCGWATVGGAKPTKRSIRSVANEFVALRSIVRKGDKSTRVVGNLVRRAGKRIWSTPLTECGTGHVEYALACRLRNGYAS